MIDHCGLVDLPIHCSDCEKLIPIKEYYHRIDNDVYCLDCDYKRLPNNRMMES